MTHTTDFEARWRGIRPAARQCIEARDYSQGDPCGRLGGAGMDVAELLAMRSELERAWIPGVEVFPRQVFQQQGRGYFAELARVEEGVLGRIGLAPRQWASALMHRDSAKGFHLHPPHIPEGIPAAQWFAQLYEKSPGDFGQRPYHLEQWDVMFFLTGITEMILVDERDGLTRRVMRFTITGDSKPGSNNAAVVIPPGVGHALRSIGNEDLIMVYGTSTSFNPAWEGRIASDVENSLLPPAWRDYLEASRSD